MYGRRHRVWAVALIVSLVTVMAAGASWAGTATEAQVLALVKSSLSITSIPTNLTPTIEQAATELTNIKVSAANYILKSCDPYWEHAQAKDPVPCWYGDKKSKKIVALWGDSNAANWVPALSAAMQQLGFKLALFGFIGCDTSFMPETSSQKGFPTEWELCNEWHKNLPRAVKKLRPVIVMEASTMAGRVGNASYNASWVKGMVKAFNELTAARRSAIRVEFQSIPARLSSAPNCLASYPTSVQTCDINLNDTAGQYSVVATRDETIAKEAHAIEIPTWQLLCYNHLCSPIVGNYLTYVDLDHLSTAYSTYLAGVMESLLLQYKALPK